MIKNLSYKTGLIVPENDLQNSAQQFRGKNWVAQRQKSQRESVSGDEIVISAKDREVAQKALNLIIGCLNLIKGECVVSPSEFKYLAFRDADIKGFSKLEKIQYFNCHITHNIPISCEMAARASYRLKFVYGISKFNFSISNCSLFLEDLEPSISQYIPLSLFPDDHVRYSYAIISAYSVIEDLGLEIRATKENPSTINGEWNPKVKYELEERLRKAGIQLDEKLMRTIRGPKTKIESKRAPRIRCKAAWAKRMIRDSSIELIDAIAHASWLRSKIASHKTRELAGKLSVYDVINVQHLARRLLLESLGYWRYWEDISEPPNLED